MSGKGRRCDGLQRDRTPVKAIGIAVQAVIVRIRRETAAIKFYARRNRAKAFHCGREIICQHFIIKPQNARHIAL